MELIKSIAPWAKHYLTIHRLSGDKTYNFSTKDFYNEPVVEYTMHIPKRDGGENTYLAVHAGIELADLLPEHLLYVGCQKADRMFRADSADRLPNNFHHTPMRRGRSGKGLVQHLREVGPVEIYVWEKQDLIGATESISALTSLKPLLEGRCALIYKRSNRQHAGYWMEQLLLMAYPGQFSWNSKGCDSESKRVLEQLLGGGIKHASVRGSRPMRSSSAAGSQPVQFANETRAQSAQVQLSNELPPVTQTSISTTPSSAIPDQDSVRVPFHIERVSGKKRFFLPDCRMKGGYEIGRRDRDKERGIKNYYVALDKLLAQSSPRFRRPNGQGKFGTVTCRPGDWEWITREAIEAMRARFEKGLISD